MMLTGFLLARIADDEESFAYDESEEHAAGSADLNDGYIAWVNQRMRRECAAKRKIVQNHLEHVGGQRGYGASRYAVLCLALVYSDHPDWDWNWRG